LSDQKPVRRLRRLSQEERRLIRDEVKRVAADERDRDEMRAIREQLAELAPGRATQASSSA
jgi:hypothetical protein